MMTRLARSASNRKEAGPRPTHLQGVWLQKQRPRQERERKKLHSHELALEVSGANGVCLSELCLLLPETGGPYKVGPKLPKNLDPLPRPPSAGLRYSF